jgi:plastocyanin
VVSPRGVLRRPAVSLCVFACSFVAASFAVAGGALAHEGEDGSAVVHVTDEGFEPRSVEVGAGDTVVFENVGEEAHWPASDDHPTHEAYSGFDPKEPIEPGAEWSFAFDRPGKWEYHDHMNPYLTGKVVVTGGEGSAGGAGEGSGSSLFSLVGAVLLDVYDAAASVFAGGEGSSSNDEAGKQGAPDEGSGALPEERYREMEKELATLVREENPRAALEKLRAEIRADDALSRSCHPLVHDVGHAAYEKYGDFGEAMKYQDEVCNSGYLHGIIESRFEESDDVFADMKTMCDPYPQGSYMSWQCYHGIGHGVMFYTANDLPRSLEMCDGFGSAFGRSNCANGVFMENFNADQKLHLSDYLKESDPFYPCGEQAERHKEICYLYAPTYFLSLNDGDYAAALEWCKDAESGFEPSCAYGVGTQAMKENLNDPGLVESVCMEGEPEQTAPCIEGMAGLYINHHGSLEPARDLCARLEKSNRPACYDSVQAHSGLFRDRST